MRDKQPRDVYQDITDKIIAAIEAGVGEARLPWQRSGLSGVLPKNVESGKHYNGINTLALMVASHVNNHPTNLYGTYRQWLAAGAQVRGGAKGTLVIFYKTYSAEPDPSHEDDDGSRRVAKASHVFNLADVDGYPPVEMPDRAHIQKIAAAEEFFVRTGIDLRIGGEQAFYRPSTDHVQMPDERLFTGDTEEERSQGFYSVLSHEAGHWTSAPGRLNRELGKRFGDEKWAMEELVAELSAGFLMAHLGLAAQPRADHACYIANWLKVLKGDKKAIFAAAARAQEAVTYLINLQPKRVAHAA
jgi:antirestriction protein ArdC